MYLARPSQKYPKFFCFDWRHAGKCILQSQLLLCSIVMQNIHSCLLLLVLIKFDLRNVGNILTKLQHKCINQSFTVSSRSQEGVVSHLKLAAFFACILNDISQPHNIALNTVLFLFWFSINFQRKNIYLWN